MEMQTLRETAYMMDMRHRKLTKDPNKVQPDKQQKLKQKFMKLQPKEQLNIIQKQRSKLQQKQARHLEYDSASTSDHLVLAAKEDCVKACKEKSRTKKDFKSKLIHKSKFDRIVQSDPVASNLETKDEPTFLASSSQIILPQESATILLEKDLETTMQLNAVASQEPQLQQQGILPQEVVLVSYNGEQIPSETGIVAYDQNGQLLLIRESDIKSVDTCGNQHLLHTFDGTTYIIDNAVETTESTYIVLDRSLVPAETLVDPNSVISLGETLQTTSDYSLQFDNWDDSEIYQAMTAFRIAETNETSSVLTLPPIMSTVETPSILQQQSSSAMLKANRRSSELSWSSQSIDDSLAQIGVLTSQQSSIPLALQLPPTVTDPVITSSIACSAVETVEDDSEQLVLTSNEYWQ